MKELDAGLMNEVLDGDTVEIIGYVDLVVDSIFR